MNTRRQNSQFYKAMIATAFVGLLALIGNDDDLVTPEVLMVDNAEDTLDQPELRENIEWLAVEKFNPDYALEQARLLIGTFKAP